ncbi:MAG: heavy-metal-associated domain-containing protein [Roseovarius sp.]|nr:heavy-metal-associated domain-containing protein [Roseovarius sp.]
MARHNFRVPDMSCGHCTGAIEKAIKAIDPTAKVSCDLDAYNVEVESFLSERVLSEAI